MEEALAGRDARIAELERDLATLGGELSSLSGLVVERERDIRSLKDEVREANERHDASVRSLEAVSSRLDELHAQARGQATRIRMKALGEAVEISRRVQDLAGRITDSSQNGHKPEENSTELFEGMIHLDIGPLGDFSQLLGFEDAAGSIEATSQISVERFSGGRATLSMRLDEPIELLRELEEHSPFEFKVRDTRGDRVVLDLDEDPGESAEAA